MTKRGLPSIFSDENGDNPFFQSLQKEMNRVFDQFRGGPVSAGELAAGGTVLPALDIAESDDMVEVTAEVPGVAEEDLEVTITDGVLTVKGEKRDEREEKEKDYHLVERRYGSFRRTVHLGFDPEDGDVDAKFEGGVLKLTIKKPETMAKATQKIAIKKA